MIFILYQTIWETIWNGIVAFFGWVSESSAIMLLLSGFIVLTWLGYERKRRGSFLKREVDTTKFNITKFLRALSYLGLILAVFAIWAGVTSLITNTPPSFKYRDITGDHVDHFTSALLIALGIAMFLKPINEFPITSIIAFVVAGLVTAFVAFNIDPNLANAIDGWIDTRILFIVMFIVIAGVIGFFGKFFIKPLQWFSNFLSWPLIAFILAIVCFVQSIALWGFGISIIPNFLSNII